MAPYDYIIVGGGAAGCVLAHRLSARRANRVVLIEAGRDTPPGAEPAEIRDVQARAVYFPQHLWPDLQVARVAPRDGGQPRLHPYEQARVMGGGTSVNAMIAMRGHPLDLDEWADLGATGWRWREVLPYYCKLERDADFEGQEHGRHGPIPIRRTPPEQWPGFTRAAAEVAKRRGYPFIADGNADFADGLCALARNVDATRITAAMAYLDATTRRRPNLEVLTETLVDRLLTEHRRVVGVRASHSNEVIELRAREVVVSAGALQSPALLMRSGIGPGDALRGIGIEVIAERPGVGQNLHEHPIIGIAAHIEPGARAPAEQRHHANAGLRYSSNLPDAPPHDMFLFMHSRFGWHPLGRRLGMLLVAVYKPLSRGSLRLRSADPREAPEICLNLLADELDLERLKAGVRLAYAFYQDPEVRPLWNNLLLASYSPRIRALNRYSRLNRIKSGLLSLLLDSNKVMRDALVRGLMSEGRSVPRVIADDADLEAWIRDAAYGCWHVGGTCRMGAPGEPSTVVDPGGRVIGVEGLRVADASIMPTSIRANTNLTAIMIGEKIADTILAGG